ncbi:MAG: hypothetical protein LBU81_03135 [Methanosarcinales archaeon]|jgi:hypothetical protein|nr:hypothetical protein [Methanosarcinales archaeon]
MIKEFETEEEAIAFMEKMIERHEATASSCVFNCASEKWVVKTVKNGKSEN